MVDWVITDDQKILPMIDTRAYNLEVGSIIMASWNRNTENPYPWGEKTQGSA